MKFLSEFWILDHSTTTAEAASHSGGTSGKGGDILYRWGNPIIYGAGTAADQQLFGQHHVRWIPNGLPGAGNVSLYNNGLTGIRTYSSVDLLELPVDSAGNYALQAGTAYAPTSAYWTYTTTNFYSNILSSAQVLHNGNILICEGKEGHLFEIDTAKNVVWDYQSPIGPSGSILIQGQTIFNSSSIFRATRYTPDYAAFVGKNLSPGATIEATPWFSNCMIHTNITKINAEQKALLVYPNPSQHMLTIEAEEFAPLEVFNSLGQRVFETTIPNRYYQLNVEDWDNGLYWFKVKNYAPQTVRIQH